MTDTATEPFNLNEQGFLQAIDQLLERFERYSSGRCFEDIERARLEHGADVPVSLFDDTVHELADELFGGTSWSMNLDMDMIMIGDIMLLIPGLMSTNAIRDVLIGDTLSGIIRLIAALLLAAALALGFMGAIILFGRF